MAKVGKITGKRTRKSAGKADTRRTVTRPPKSAAGGASKSAAKDDKKKSGPAKTPAATKTPATKSPGKTGDRFRVQVKNRGGKRTLSSKLWLDRQLNDPYVERAKKEGYRSRAAYKLKEIDDRYKILKSGQAIVDLGAAPGGWSQIAAKKVGSEQGRGRVIAIDLLEMPEIAGVEFAQIDFLEDSAPETLRAMLGGGADVVMSDMAANTTGHRTTDQLRIMGLVENAAHFAREVLNPGGTFLAKVFQGGADSTLVAQLKQDYATVRHVKPEASRAGSSERYVLATGFRHKR
jgi:23S rRNA (uridine2552-2'-O)-methyltransferase